VVSSKKPWAAIAATASLAVLGGVTLIDLIVSAPRRYAPVAFAGLAIAAVWCVVFLSWRALVLRDRRSFARGACSGLLIAGLAALLAGVAYTLPRFGPSHLDTPMGVLTISSGSGIVGFCAAVAWFNTHRESTVVTAHQEGSRVEVWHVHDRKLDYYVAHCECDWIGPAHDAIEPNASDQARSDAAQHGTNVATDIIDMPA